MLLGRSELIPAELFDNSVWVDVAIIVIMTESDLCVYKLEVDNVVIRPEI